MDNIPPWESKPSKEGCNTLKDECYKATSDNYNTRLYWIVLALCHDKAIDKLRSVMDMNERAFRGDIYAITTQLLRCRLYRLLDKLYTICESFGISFSTSIDELTKIINPCLREGHLNTLNWLHSKNMIYGLNTSTYICYSAQLWLIEKKYIDKINLDYVDMEIRCAYEWDNLTILERFRVDGLYSVDKFKKDGPLFDTSKHNYYNRHYIIDWLVKNNYITLDLCPTSYCIGQITEFFNKYLSYFRGHVDCKEDVEKIVNFMSRLITVNTSADTKLECSLNFISKAISYRCYDAVKWWSKSGLPYDERLIKDLMKFEYDRHGLENATCNTCKMTSLQMLLEEGIKFVYDDEPLIAWCDYLILNDIHLLKKLEQNGFPIKCSIHKIKKYIQECDTEMHFEWIKTKVDFQFYDRVANNAVLTGNIMRFFQYAMKDMTEQGWQIVFNTMLTKCQTCILDKLIKPTEVKEELVVQELFAKYIPSSEVVIAVLRSATNADYVDIVHWLFDRKLIQFEVWPEVYVKLVLYHSSVKILNFIVESGIPIEQSLDYIDIMMQKSNLSLMEKWLDYDIGLCNNERTLDKIIRQRKKKSHKMKTLKWWRAHSGYNVKWLRPKQQTIVNAVDFIFGKEVKLKDLSQIIAEYTVPCLNIKTSVIDPELEAFFKGETDVFNFNKLEYMS